MSAREEGGLISLSRESLQEEKGRVRQQEARAERARMRGEGAQQGERNHDIKGECATRMGIVRE